jgi:Acetyltransferase (GNAT) domain
MPDVCQIRPLSDPRWKNLLLQQPAAPVFHSEPWLSALRKTYGFEPLALTTSSPAGDLCNALLFCRVNSPLTGQRIVSLPFSDHCAPLTTDDRDLSELIAAVQSQLTDRRLRYVEMRPVEPLPDPGPCHTVSTCRWHRLNLASDLCGIYGRFHPRCVVGKIHRAEREHLVYRKGNSDRFFADFWKLYMLTRRRHHAPPQPQSWFRNLLSGFGEAAAIHIALKDDNPIAAIFTLEFKDTLVYKYGCSEPHHQALGGTHLLFWRAIQDAKARGLRCFDLGRSDYSDEGLIRFKDRWGAIGCDLVYSRFTADPYSRGGYRTAQDSVPQRVARRVAARLPDSLFATIGALLYKHIA